MGCCADTDSDDEDDRCDDHHVKNDALDDARCRMATSEHPGLNSNCSEHTLTNSVSQVQFDELSTDELLRMLNE